MNNFGKRSYDLDDLKTRGAAARSGEGSRATTIAESRLGLLAFTLLSCVVLGIAATQFV